ncbi:hypothetical protein KQI22_09675 [Kineothrix sp. MSJ-39]|uniref:hypothetical protein n=1 Tax=Kineothrix sp. MSJ-39 TaxID=2841533 RepID=UPI001C122042|nr:hypothetical protein [Kineothrix sp. MSJ-39]MBU5430327.1 hypothetical protein [Kineothrix sp. MSJ-39]
MKKKHIQKWMTVLLSTTLLFSSIPVMAETVSENETSVIVDESVEQEAVEEAGESIKEVDIADIETDQEKAHLQVSIRTVSLKYQRSS